MENCARLIFIRWGRQLRGGAGDNLRFNIKCLVFSKGVENGQTMERDFNFLLAMVRKCLMLFRAIKLLCLFLGRPSDKLQSHSANSSISARGVSNFYKDYVTSEHIKNVTTIESFR